MRSVRQLSDGARAPDCDRIARFNIRILCRHIAGRENVAEKENFLVVDAFGTNREFVSA